MATTRLGQLVRERRDALHMTQAQLAEHVGISGQAIYSIEVGKTAIPTPAVLAGLARVLDMLEIDLLRAVGYLQDANENTAAQLEAESAWRRIQALPLDERMEAIKRLSPATYDLVLSSAYAILDRAAGRQDQPEAQSRQSENTDRQASGERGSTGR